MHKTNPRGNKLRRLFADIETSPNVVLAFSAGFNQTINHDAIVEERRIICIGYKWEGDRKTHVIRWDENQDDKQMLKEFVEVANGADEIVGHYGNHFDWPWIRTRILFHKLPAIPVWKTIDTKALASKYFYFNSNKLDYISNFLGHGKKLHTDFSLWKRIVLEHDEAALNYMCKYCGRDVTRLELVYKDFAPFVKPRTHSGVLLGREKWTCPHDGSKNVHTDKTMVTASGTKQYKMQCNVCGHYYVISEAAHRDYLECKKKNKN